MEDKNQVKVEKRIMAKGFPIKMLLTFLFVLAIPVVAYFIYKDYRKGPRILTTLFENTEFIKELSNFEVAEHGTNEEIDRNITKYPGMPWESTAALKVKFRANYVYVISSVKTDWKLKYIEDDGIAYIEAPKLCVKTPVAIPTDSIQKYVNGGWLIMGKEEELNKIVSGLTHYVNSRGNSQNALGLVKDKARSSIEKFFYEWILKGKIKVTSIRVKFPDEPDFGLLDREKNKL